ncbi:hypothetical protein Dimus_023794 [Dionaea muscipula]
MHMATHHFGSQLLSHLLLNYIILVCCCTIILLIKGDHEDLIESTCKKTTAEYHDLCLSSLRSDPSSDEAEDVKALAIIMVHVGIANATATYNSLVSIINISVVAKPKPERDTTTMKKVITICADKYSNANASLGSANEDLSMDNYDYASLHLAAAADYPNACHDAFKRYPGLTYPTELARRETGLRSICAVALDILNLVLPDLLLIG